MHGAICFVYERVLQEPEGPRDKRVSTAASEWAENSRKLHLPDCYRRRLHGPAPCRLPQSQRAGQPVPACHRRFQGEDFVCGTKLSTWEPV